MTRQRILSLSRLKPESVKEYVHLHRQVPPELLDAYRKAGIDRIHCFLSGTDLVVFSEVDGEVYAREKETLSRHPAEVRWQALMKSLRDPEFEPASFDEVYSISFREEKP